MYKTATGGWADHRHAALGDARCIREVLLWLLNYSPSPLYLTEPPPNPVKPIAVDTCPISCRPVPLTRASVAELLTPFPQSPIPRRGDRAAIARYSRLLDESVQDGRLSFDEAAALLKQARLTRVTGTQLRELHRNAWNAAFPEEASADWTTLTLSRRREMFLLAEGLDLTVVAEKMGAVIRSLAEPGPPPEARYLRGLRIGIATGDAALLVLRERAESYGAKIAVNITKTVEWLATVTPDAADSRHNSARKLGIPILTPRDARERLDESIRRAEFKAFERRARRMNGRLGAVKARLRLMPIGAPHGAGRNSTTIRSSSTVTGKRVDRLNVSVLSRLTSGMGDRFAGLQAPARTFPNR
jgi:hypothetical protein